MKNEVLLKEYEEFINPISWGEVTIPEFEYEVHEDEADIIFKYNPLYEVNGTPADADITIKSNTDSSLNGSWSKDRFEDYKDILVEIFGHKGTFILATLIDKFNNPYIQADMDTFVEDYFDEDGNCLLDEDGCLIE